MINKMNEVTITITKDKFESGVFNYPKRGDIMHHNMIVKNTHLTDYFTHVLTVKPLSKYKLIRKLQIWYYKHF